MYRNTKNFSLTFTISLKCQKLLHRALCKRETAYLNHVIGIAATGLISAAHAVDDYIASF